MLWTKHMAQAGALVGHTPSRGWDFAEEIPEKNRKNSRKRSQSVSWNSPREYGWDPPSPTIQGI